MGCFLLALLKNERKQKMDASGPAVRGKKRTRTLAEAEEAGGAGAQELNAEDVHDSIDIQNNISELHSEVRNILVDMSSWLVPLCNSSIAFAQKFCLEPKISLHAEIHELLGSRISYFENLGRRLIFVFDNARNVLKQETNKLRSATQTEAMKKLEEMWLDPDVPYTTISPDNYKKCTHVRDDVVQCAYQFLIDRDQAVIFAPSEADPQLVSAQLAGLGDAILTEDSDILGLGGKLVICGLSFSTGKCFIFSQEELINAIQKELTSDLNHRVTFEDAPLFCTIQGNDYINKPHKKEMTFQTYLSSSEEERETAFAKIQSRLTHNNNKTARLYDNSFLYKSAFMHSMNWFRHAPVFKITLHERYEITLQHWIN